MIKNYYGYNYTFNPKNNYFCVVDDLCEGVIMETQNEFEVFHFIEEKLYNKFGLGNRKNEIRYSRINL